MKRLRFECPACFRQVTVFAPEVFKNTPKGIQYECACYFCKTKVLVTEQPIDYVESVLLKKEFDINKN